MSVFAGVGGAIRDLVGADMSLIDKINACDCMRMLNDDGTGIVYDDLKEFETTNESVDVRKDTASFSKVLDTFVPFQFAGKRKLIKFDVAWPLRFQGSVSNEDETKILNGLTLRFSDEATGRSYAFSGETLNKSFTFLFDLVGLRDSITLKVSLDYRKAGNIRSSGYAEINGVHFTIYPEKRYYIE